MNMEIQEIGPPSYDPGVVLGDWFTPRGTEELEAYLAAEVWGGVGSPVSWKVARLSSAAYIYREVETNWAVVAKFFGAKTGAGAGKYARREYDQTQNARQLGLDREGMRAVAPLAVWRGVLLFEYVPGLTLEDIIAIRRSHPGTLLPALEKTADILASLHRLSAKPDEASDFERAIAQAHKYLRNLSKYGVLKRRPFRRRNLSRLIDHWAANSRMTTYVPVFNHGDTTTTNFIFPPEGGIVAIDWERAKVTDPAADVGRLLAEVSHGITDHGGNLEEVAQAVNVLQARYCASLPTHEARGPLMERARFHQASSTLRIARNGWLSPAYRLSLVERASGLLSDNY
ncbi:MAG: phosphotransferase [Anaerolineales bacterium]|nr:phosphotransferase [Anaerolineales bacterium]